uniref:(northern house mosquito) hypothetical protein n=1 Tax=Culex pipiens TaxID=7175 RepID=A0A8D8ATD9_CULPI
MLESISTSHMISWWEDIPAPPAVCSSHFRLLFQFVSASSPNLLPNTAAAALPSSFFFAPSSLNKPAAAATVALLLMFAWPCCCCFFFSCTSSLSLSLPFSRSRTLHTSSSPSPFHPTPRSFHKASGPEIEGTFPLAIRGPLFRPLATSGTRTVHSTG